jgi:protein SCO1/2
MRPAGGIVLLMALGAAACSRAPEPREYEVRGQILRVDPERQEVLVDHEDIEGFMPAMTMPYRVRDVGLLDGREPGDLFTATLVVEETSAYLSTITRTGHEPLESPVVGPAITAADVIQEGDVVPDGALVNQDGAPLPMTSLRGHRVALTFIYTRCPLPDFCPLMDRHFAELQRTIASTPSLEDVRLVSVTLDPEYDTPAVLEAHAGLLQADPARWQFATGEPDEVLAFAKQFGVLTEAGDPSSPILHNLRTAVIDAQGHLAAIHSGNMWMPAELVADLEAAAAPAR